MEKRTLLRAIAGKSREKLHLYELAARRYNIQPIYFSLDRINLKRRRVDGYINVGGGKYRPVNAPLPRVIHRRIIASTPSDIRLLRSLCSLRAVTVFNPPVQRDKFWVNRLLSRYPEIRSSIPTTYRHRTTADGLRLAQTYPTIFAKPALGSVGRGVYKIQKLDDRPAGGRYEIVSWRGSRKIVHSAGLKQWLAAHCNRGYIVQQGVNLALYRGRPFDIRVTVQRGNSGGWSVTGMVVRVARSGKPVTNLGRGGSTRSVDQVLAQLFPDSVKQRRIRARLGTLALSIAHRLSNHWPGLADLGLDLALDNHGKAWFLEVNFREQRPSFREVGGKTAAYKQYAQPMAYAAYLLHRRKVMDSA